MGDEGRVLSGRIRRDLDDFLKVLPDRAPLGPEKPTAVGATDALARARDVLVKRLDKRLTQSRGVAMLIVACYVVVFGLVTAYVLSSWRSPNVWLLITGESGSVVALVAILRTFWRDIAGLELLVALLPNVPPERAMEIAREWVYAREGKN